MSGLPHRVNDASFHDYFSQFGAVTDAVVKRNVIDGTPRGFGFVTFSSPDVYQQVMAQPEHTIHGRKLTLKPADGKDQASRQRPSSARSVGVKRSRSRSRSPSLTPKRHARPDPAQSERSYKRAERFTRQEDSPAVEPTNLLGRLCPTPPTPTPCSSASRGRALCVRRANPGTDSQPARAASRAAGQAAPAPKSRLDIASAPKSGPAPAVEPDSAAGCTPGRPPARPTIGGGRYDFDGPIELAGGENESSVVSLPKVEEVLASYTNAANRAPPPALAVARPHWRQPTTAAAATAAAASAITAAVTAAPAAARVAVAAAPVTPTAPSALTAIVVHPAPMEIGNSECSRVSPSAAAEEEEATRQLHRRIFGDSDGDDDNNDGSDGSDAQVRENTLLLTYIRCLSPICFARLQP